MKARRQMQFLVAGAAIVAIGGLAAADQVATDLQAELANLRARVAQLQSARSDQWMTQQRAEEIRGLVQDVLADADTRASLLDNGMTGGWDKGFFLASADGDFRLDIKGQIQFRFIYSNQDESLTGDDDRWGFENTRTRFSFGGHIVDPSWKYFIWAGWTGSGSSLLLDAWIKKDLGGGWSIQAGQFKLPVWWEWNVSETRQQFVERSVLDARYAALYAQGVQLHYGSDKFRLHAAFSDGLRTWNTAYSTPPSTVTGTMPYQQSTEYALTARAELLLGGSWSQYADFTSWGDEEPMYVIGGSIHYQDGEYGTIDDESEIVQWSIDGSFEFGGANLHAAVIGNHIESLTVDRDEYGVLVQGGVFLNDDWELIARYEWGDLDGAGLVSDDLSIVTVGINRFWSKHALKWTTDLGYAFKEVDAAWDGASRGWRADSFDEDGQIVLRSQLQLLF